MKTYYRVMLGRGSVYATECFAGGFIGTDFGIMEGCLSYPVCKGTRNI